MDSSVLRRKRTRRELLTGAVRLGAGAAAVAAFGPQILRSAMAEERRPERVKVLIEDVTEETAAAFARGRASAVEIVVEAGRAALRGTAGGEFTSGILALPFPATHLGLHWVLRDALPEAVALAVRSSGDGRRWSAWQALEIEAVTERPSGREVFAFLAGANRPRYAQYKVRFSSGSPVMLDGVTVTAINSSDGPRAPLPAGTLSTVALTAPGGSRIDVVTREGWGCDESLVVAGLGKDRDTLWPEMYVPAKKVVLHHTATSNGYADGAAEVRAVWSYHAITLGWGDIGYNALVDRFGNIYEGRHGRGEDPATREILSADVVAGHVYYHNYGSTGIAAVGHFDRTQPTEAMLRAIDAAVAFECDRHLIDASKASDFLRSDDLWHDGLNNCCGHYESYSTSCPGRNLRTYLPTLRGNVASRLGWSTTTSLAETSGAPRDRSVGDSVSFAWDNASLFCLEGWYKEPDKEPITYLSGYQPSDEKYADPLAESQRWEPIGNWSNPYTFTAPGHYTMHVRAASGAYQANLTFLVKGSGPGGGPSPVTVHVGDLDGTVKIKGKGGRWEALVTVTVHDANHSPVANATVAGTWSGATSGSVSGVTGGDGTITLSTGSISGGTSVTFEVTSVSGEGLSYDGGANHDPDGDSNGTSITVGK